ncbi:MAG TPA: copper chaperone PCu(A)C [Croceibacterium sp.]
MRRLVFALCLVFAAASCGPPPAPLEVEDAWTRDTVGNTASAAVFMTISSPTPDRLIAASAPVARQTDLMTMEAEGGTMAMAYLEAIDIPAGETVSLDPQGLHVWLANLNRPLVAGQTFPLTLEFEHAGERQVTVSIIAPAAAPPMSGMGM